MPRSFDEDEDHVLTREIRRHVHDEGASGRNLCAAVVISSWAVDPGDGALLELLDDAEDPRAAS
jgi:hypothetical protein